MGAESASLSYARARSVRDQSNQLVNPWLDRTRIVVDSIQGLAGYLPCL